MERKGLGLELKQNPWNIKLKHNRQVDYSFRRECAQTQETILLPLIWSWIEINNALCHWKLLKQSSGRKELLSRQCLKSWASSLILYWKNWRYIRHIKRRGSGKKPRNKEERKNKKDSTKGGFNQDPKNKSWRYQKVN